MGQIVGIDTSVFIYFFEDHQKYADQAERILTLIESGKMEGVFSVVGLIEILTGPKKQKKEELAYEYKELITHFPHLRIQGIGEKSVDISSHLRAKYGITTPDALHVAAAIEAGAEQFITNDKRLSKIKEIDICLMHEYM